MKSFAGMAAVLGIASTVLDTVAAVEHPLLASTADFAETWIDRPDKTDMISTTRDLQYTKLVDHGKRPVIGVLTEPLRGDLFKASDRYSQLEQGDDGVPGYVPRAHVQFLEQAGVRVVPIDYRLSRDELVEMFD